MPLYTYFVGIILSPLSYVVLMWIGAVAALPELKRTSLALATVGTIRLSLLKLGARITISCRRILLAIATACPYQDILGIAYSRIQAIPDSG